MGSTAPGYKLFDLLKKSDYCMTISSTTAVEAAMFKKGIIVLQPKIPYEFIINYNG
ncbi:hypothetical protein [Salipaludibacillus neizhouensis]|uniref:hypothetical protein n=1 Tax=Salipaludibacillus neizhouensis TaxID=885475 RepID=UPI0016008650|nr:hypothetical protein [Salipaludibacillus neizhouensis]